MTEPVFIYTISDLFELAVFTLFVIGIIVAGFLRWWDKREKS